MPTLLLIRHAANDWLGSKRLAGWTPGVRLNERGRQQAAELAERLAPLAITAIYSSPLERAVETAEAVAGRLGLAVGIEPDLGEVRYGDWEGRVLDEVSKTEMWPGVQFYPSGTRFPGGETLHEVQARAVRALERIAGRHAGKNDVVAVVSHADVIKAVLAHFAGMHLDLFQRLVVSPASVSIVQFTGLAPRLLRLNDDGPLRLPVEEEPAEAPAPAVAPARGED